LKNVCILLTTKTQVNSSVTALSSTQDTVCISQQQQRLDQACKAKPVRVLPFTSTMRLDNSD